MDESINARERLQRLGTGSLGQPVGSWEQEKEWLIAQVKRVVERWHDARSRLAAGSASRKDGFERICARYLSQGS